MVLTVPLVWITLAAMSGDFIRPVESMPVRAKGVVTEKTHVADTKDIKIPANADTKDIKIPGKTPKPGNVPAVLINNNKFPSKKIVKFTNII